MEQNKVPTHTLTPAHFKQKGTDNSMEKGKFFK